VRVNLLGDEEWDRDRDRPGWQWKALGVGRKLGAEKIGASMYELAPGQKAFPYHWHQVQEEWLIVLRGEATLRDPTGERTLGPGDCVCFKRGAEGAHQIRNDTAEPVRLLMLSSDAEAEVVEYPDSAKVGIWGNDIRKILRGDAEVDYFEGEE
jgi:uncharacterized cupin superfamily protein